MDFSFEADSDLLDIPFVSFAAPVEAKLRFSISEDDAVQVRGRIDFTLVGSCSRCLDPAEQNVSGEVDAVFVKSEPEDVEYRYQGGAVDLREMLRDAVLFALPRRILCSRCAEEENHS